MDMVSRRWMWVESMDVASGCGCKGYKDFLILLIPTALVSVHHSMPSSSIELRRQEKPISRVNGSVMARLVVPIQAILDPLYVN